MQMTLSVIEAAQRLGVGQHSLRRAVRAGAVRALRVGKRVRVPVSELERIVKEPESFRREAENGRDAAGG